MDFTLNEEQLALQETVRRFAQAELADLARQVEADGRPPGREVVKRYAELGLLGVNLPPAYGGAGQGHLEAVLVLEEVAKISIAVAFPIFESCFGPTLAVANLAPEALRQRILPQVCAGDMMIAVAMSEPDAGSALTDLATRARIEGDGSCCAARSAGARAPAMPMPMWSMPASRMHPAPGASARCWSRRTAPASPSASRRELMGFRGVPSADMFFDDVTVPAANLVVPAGGFRQLMEAFDLERCGNTTMSLACAQSAFDAVLAYVQERRQFGKPLVDFQAVQIQLAEMRMMLDASRLLLYRAVVNAARGMPSVGESSIAKCFANEMAREVTGKALQLMGGYGYARAFPIEQKMRDAWGWGIAGGAIDIQKVNIAAAMVDRRFDQRA